VTPGGSPQPAVAHWSTRQLPVLGLTTLVQVVTVMTANCLVVIAPVIAGVLQVQPALIGFQVSVVYLAAMLAVIFGGRLTQRFGACRVQQCCLGLAALGALGSMVPSLFAVAAASFVMGLATGPTTPAASHALTRFTDPANRNLIFSLKQTGVPLGVVSAAFLMPTLTVAFGHVAALGVVVAIALTGIVLLQPARRSWDDDRVRGVRLIESPLGGLRVVWRLPVMRWLSLGAFFYAFTQLCVTTFTVTMLVTEAGFGLVQAGLLLALVQFSGVCSRIVLGIWADRLGSALAPMAMLGGATAVMCAVTAFLDPGWPRIAMYVMLICLGASAVGWTGMFIAEVARLAPKGQVGLCTSGAIAFNFLGILCGPALYAVAYKWIGSYAHTFGLLTVIALTGGGLLLYARQVEARQRVATGAGLDRTN
jgi:MFS family permease